MASLRRGNRYQSITHLVRGIDSWSYSVDNRPASTERRILAADEAVKTLGTDGKVHAGQKKLA
jgi:hypothetical protein